MPYLSIETNVAVPTAQRDALLAAASQQVSAALGKAEDYVMVALHDQTPMRFAGQNGPCAFLQLASLDLSDDQCPELAAILCDFVGKYLDVPANRSYIQFTDATRARWGWNHRTFAG